MGVAMIIPGVSGGTVAVIFGIYDELIDAINGIRKNFKKSVSLILPVLLGVIAGFAALTVPLGYALEYAPLPTVLLFAGLMIGSFPKILGEAKDRGFKARYDIWCIALPALALLGISFAKLFSTAGAADLSPSMPVYNYFLLAVISVFASCALVVPGISGSMIMMIFGFYDPLIDALKGITENLGHNVLVLFCAAAGVILGFFSIAKLMKFLLTKFPRGTYWAIVGFVAASIPALFITYPANFPSAPFDGMQLGLGIALCVAGGVAAYLITLFADKKLNK